MKHFLFISLIAMPFVSAAQGENDDLYRKIEKKTNYISEEKISLVEGRVVLQQTFETGKSKDEMYSIVKNWLADVFQESERAITFEDKDSGRIKGRCNALEYSDVLGYAQYRNWFTFDINVKDNKARIIFSEITFEGPTPAVNYKFFAEQRITDEAIDKSHGKNKRLNQQFKSNMLARFNAFGSGLQKATREASNASQW